MLKWTDRPRQLLKVRDKLIRYQRLIRSVRLLIYNCDALMLIPKVCSMWNGVFIYADPPHNTPWPYYRFSDFPQKALHDLLLNINVRVLLKCEESDKWLLNLPWKRIVMRQKSQTVHSRKDYKLYFLYNYKIGLV